MCYTHAMKVIAFDIGDRRIGVAVSDPSASYALPADTYFRTGKFSEDVAAIARIAGEKEADVIVCGLPLNADGSESVQSEKTRRFAAALSDMVGGNVVLEDERFTTRAARGDLNFMGVSAKKDKKKKHVDSLAAAYILESYLENQKRSETMKEERNDYDEENNIVEIVDDEGKSYRYEHLLTFEYKKEWYVALTPEKSPEEADGENEDEGDEVAIYHLVGGEDDEQLETIEDDALLEEVFAEFCAQYEDFEDADEAAALEPDDDGE